MTSSMPQRDLGQRLCEAAMRGDETNVRLLLEEGADVHANDNWPLRWAAGGGYCSIVRRLLDAGADVHAQDDAALQWAAQNGHTEIVGLLIKYKANPRTGNDCPLFAAAYDARFGVVDALVRHIFQPQDWQGKPPEAVDREAAALVRKLKAYRLCGKPIRQDYIDYTTDCITKYALAVFQLRRTETNSKGRQIRPRKSMAPRPL